MEMKFVYWERNVFLFGIDFFPKDIDTETILEK